MDSTAPADPAYLSYLLDRYRTTLTRDVLPFWEPLLDQAYGGLHTCVTNDGVVESADKWGWSQFRAVWVYARLYNSAEVVLGAEGATSDTAAGRALRRRVADHREAWLSTARRILDFMMAHGWDEEVQGWRLCLSGDGRKVLRGCESVYTDAFAIYACVEYWRACASEQALATAVATAECVMRRLAAPDSEVPHFPYPIPRGAKVHGIRMMFAHVLWFLGEASGEARWLSESQRLSGEIMSDFLHGDLVRERVRASDGGVLPGRQGSVVVPGHVIESMWFQLEIQGARGDAAAVERCARVMLRHFELGWDDTFGGLLLAVDVDGRDAADTAWGMADAKLWWPHSEAWLGALMAYQATGRPEFLAWHDKIHEWAYARFPFASGRPDGRGGEWMQKLSRDGRPFTDVVALPVKDPFHLPRALIMACEVLGKLLVRARWDHGLRLRGPLGRAGAGDDSSDEGGHGAGAVGGGGGGVRAGEGPVEWPRGSRSPRDVRRTRNAGADATHAAGSGGYSGSGSIGSAVRHGREPGVGGSGGGGSGGSGSGGGGAATTRRANGRATDATARKKPLRAGSTASSAWRAATSAAVVPGRHRLRASRSAEPAGAAAGGGGDDGGGAGTGSGGDANARDAATAEPTPPAVSPYAAPVPRATSSTAAGTGKSAKGKGNGKRLRRATAKARTVSAAAKAFASSLARKAAASKAASTPRRATVATPTARRQTPPHASVGGSLFAGPGLDFEVTDRRVAG